MNPLLQTTQSHVQAVVCDLLSRRLEQLAAPPALKEPMCYGVLGPGKCFRPVLVFGSGALFRVPEEQLTFLAAAAELIHAYSLIHDDLPAMDDAALRRGRPSCHRAFSQGQAILAGDALIPLAFELLAEPKTHPLPDKRLAVLRLLAQLIGAQGMVSGQTLDLFFKPEGATVTLLEQIQHLKTGALFGFCVQAPACLGEASLDQRHRLEAYVECLALVFQMKDDLLESQDIDQTGKQSQRLALTWPGLIGEEETVKRLNRKLEEGLDALQGFGEQAQLLREVLQFAASRTR